RPWGVEEGQPVAEIIDAGDVGLHAHRVTARLRAGIPDAGAFADGALARHSAAAQQNPFKKTGFSALKWPNDRHETGAGDPVLGIDSVQYQPPWRYAARRETARAPFAKAIDLPDPVAPSDAVFSVPAAPWPWRRPCRPLRTLLSCDSIVARTGAARKTVGGRNMERRRYRSRRACPV